MHQAFPSDEIPSAERVGQWRKASRGLEVVQHTGLQMKLGHTQVVKHVGWISTGNAGRQALMLQAEVSVAAALIGAGGTTVSCLFSFWLLFSPKVHAACT